MAVLPNPIYVGILPTIMNMNSAFAHKHHVHHHIPARPGDSLRVPEST